MELGIPWQFSRELFSRTDFKAHSLLWMAATLDLLFREIEFLRCG